MTPATTQQTNEYAITIRRGRETKTITVKAYSREQARLGVMEKLGEKGWVVVDDADAHAPQAPSVGEAPPPPPSATGEDLGRASSVSHGSAQEQMLEQMLETQRQTNELLHKLVKSEQKKTGFSGGRVLALLILIIVILMVLAAAFG